MQYQVENIDFFYSTISNKQKNQIKSREKIKIEGFKDSRGQGFEGKGQRSEDRSQKTEIRKEVRGQEGKTEVRGQRA